MTQFVVTNVTLRLKTVPQTLAVPSINTQAADHTQVSSKQQPPEICQRLVFQSSQGPVNGPMVKSRLQNKRFVIRLQYQKSQKPASDCTTTYIVPFR